MGLGDFLNELPGVGSFIDTEEEKKRKRRREAAARAAARKKPKKPDKVPKTTTKKKEYGPKEAALDLVVPGRMFGKVFGKAAEVTHAPTIIRSIPSDVAELGAGLLPAAKTIGGVGYRDVRRLARHHDAPTREDMAKYYDLLKWTIADEKGDKKAMPKTDSEMIGLVAQMTRGWGRGIERALPDPTDPADMKEFRKAWTEDPVFSALDVIPFGAAITRPLSIARHAREISLANDISVGKAIAAGTRESYYPGSAARGAAARERRILPDTKARPKLKGGVEPRRLRATVGGHEIEVEGRPWSRIPLMREFQRTTDELYNLSPGLSRKRVGRVQERLEREDKRRIVLGQKELERPIGEMLYGRVGRTLGSFGLKEGMSAKERRTATGLAYATQMPKHMDPSEALAAVQEDLSSVLKSGTMEIPRGRGRVKRVPLSADEKNNLAVQISDLDMVRKELDDGDITHDEWTAAQEAMSSMAGESHKMGIDIMRRRYKMDPDEVAALEATWKARAEILPRRLLARGVLTGRDVSESTVRAERLAQLTDQLGPEEAQMAVALTDSIARRVMPQDPARYWDTKVGLQRPGETAEAYVNRVGEEALFPQTGSLGSELLHYSPSEEIFDSYMGGDAVRAKVEDVPRDVKGVLVPVLNEFGDQDMLHMEFTRRVAPHYYLKSPAGYGEVLLKGSDEVIYGPPQYLKPLAPGALEAGEGVRSLLGTGEFFSPLQKWVDEQPENHWTAAQLEGTLKNKIPPNEFENAGLNNFFHDLDPTEIVYKTEFQTHLANPLNAYNLREILLSNADGVPDDLRTVFDFEHQGNYMSRDPARGEYFELLLQLPGPPIYKGKGMGHWSRPNIAAHVRFHIFHEDGKLKMLVEEIQSDWGNEHRVNLARKKAYEKMDPEARDEIDMVRNELKTNEAKLRVLQSKRHTLNTRIEEAQNANDFELRGELEQEYYDAFDEIDRLKEDNGVAERFLSDYMDDGTPIAPLGTGTGPRSSYINPSIRWLLRRADEAGVDEIHVVARETQLVRNAKHLDIRTFRKMLDSNEGAEDATRWFKDNPYERGRAYIGYDEDIPNAFAREMGVEGVRHDEAYSGTYRTPMAMEPGDDLWGQMPATVFKMTDEAKAAAKRPGSMYQRQPDWKGLPHGAAELLEGGNSIIHLFETGNLSTWIHELGHVGLYDLHPDDLRIIETHLGGGFKLEDWSKMEHERFARAFEEYIRKGKAPNKELAGVFSKLSEWMKEIWRQSKDKNAPEIAPEVQKVFDSMFAGPDAPDELAVHGYFPHRDIHAAQQADYRGGVRPPAAGQTIGIPRLAGDTIQKNPNEMMLYQGGKMNPDPGGLVSVFLNRLRFKTTLDARDDMWEVGHPMSEPPPKGAWLVRNPDAVPERIPEQAQAAVRGTDLKRPVDEDMEDMLRLDPEEFRKEIIARAGEKPKWAADMENVRWVEGDYVKTRFGDVFESKPRGGMSSGLGLLTSLQRATGIYGRPLSYIGGNVPFNVAALLSSMPVSTMRNAGRTLAIKSKDPKLWRKINSESGETRAGGGLPEHYVRPQSALQGAEQRATRVQRGMAEKLSGFADDPYRSIAFVNNARKRGYRTNADLHRLIDEDGTDLHEVRQLVREQMLDFDALNPTQRRFASQMLYLWPFMYASAKWPAMFAREYPARAAAAAQAIEENPEKGLPQEVTNLWKRYGIDLGTINPLGPVGQMAEDLGTSIEDPTKLDLTALQERLSPTLGVVAEGLAGGRKHALQNITRQTIPGAAELFSFDPEYRGAKIYKDRSQESYLAQRHLRYWPRGINKERLGELIDQALKDKVSGSTHEKEMDADWKKITKYAKGIDGGYTPDEIQEIRTSYKAWWQYQEAVDEKKDSLGQRKLTPYQQIEVLTPIVEENYPDLAPQLWHLDQLKDEAYQKRNEKALNDYADALKNAINEGRSMVFNDYSSYGPES